MRVEIPSRRRVFMKTKTNLKAGAATYQLPPPLPPLSNKAAADDWLNPGSGNTTATDSWTSHT
jgi:hypothetical protein